MKSVASRRTRMLEVARAMLGEHGYEGVTVRAVAQASGVTVPTIYNQFGGKDGLLLAAVEAQFSELLSAVRDAPASVGPERVLAVFDACNRQLVEAPRYSRTMMQLFMAAPGTRTTSMRMAAELTTALAHALAPLVQSGVLAAWVDPRALAARLGAHYLATVVAWSAGAISSKSLAATSRYEAGLALLGLIRSSRARTRFERELAALQSIVQARTLTNR